MKLIVVSTSFHAAYLWAREQGFQPSWWLWAGSAQSLRGMPSGWPVFQLSSLREFAGSQRWELPRALEAIQARPVGPAELGLMRRVVADGVPLPDALALGAWPGLVAEEVARTMAGTTAPEAVPTPEEVAQIGPSVRDVVSARLHSVGPGHVVSAGPFPQSDHVQGVSMDVAAPSVTPQFVQEMWRRLDAVDARRAEREESLRQVSSAFEVPRELLEEARPDFRDEVMARMRRVDAGHVSTGPFPASPPLLNPDSPLRETTDIIDAIDAATGCQLCGRSLAGSVSDDFCCQEHQQRWHERHNGLPPTARPDVPVAALPLPDHGYRDPASWSPEGSQPQPRYGLFQFQQSPIDPAALEGLREGLRRSGQAMREHEAAFASAARVAARGLAQITESMGQVGPGINVVPDEGMPPDVVVVFDPGNPEAGMAVARLAEGPNGACIRFDTRAENGSVQPRIHSNPNHIEGPGR